MSSSSEILRIFFFGYIASLFSHFQHCHCEVHSHSVSLSFLVTHILWRLSILIFCDNVPWWKALFLFTTLALDMYVGTEYSYSLVLGNCLIFSTIFFFLSFMEILLGQLMDLLHCSSNFLIFSLLFSIFLSFAVIILFPNKFFQLFQFCLSFLLNFYFCDCIFNF